jgi:hypothetical protein
VLAHERTPLSCKLCLNLVAVPHLLVKLDEFIVHYSLEVVRSEGIRNLVFLRLASKRRLLQFVKDMVTFSLVSTKNVEFTAVLR